MEITKAVLRAYSQLGLIEEDIEDGRAIAALNKSDNLIKMLAEQKISAQSHDNYPLIKREIDSLAEEAAAMQSIAYGLGLIRSHPFGAVIHLGNQFVTKNCPELEPLRRELHERAYEAWTGSDWINDRGGARINDL